jgi:hypothetical protein
VVGSEDLENRPPRRPREDGRLDDAEREGGQEQGPKSRPEPGRPAVEASGLHPAEADGEEEYEEKAGPERRDRDAQLREEHRDVVAGPSAPGRRVDSERNRDQRHEDRREPGERERDGEAAQDQAPDGHVVLDGAPEVAPQRAAEPLDVLDRDRPVEPHRPPERRSRLGAPLGPHDEEGRVSGEHADNGEHEERDDEQRGEERHGPAQDQPTHPRPPGAASQDSAAPRGTPGRARTDGCTA